MYRIGQEEIDEIAKVIETKDFFKINNSLQETKQVEQKLNTKFGSKYSIFMTSGHAALTSALIALGVGPGDQVIVPAYTYIASAMAVVAVGAIPVLAEVDDSLTISPESIEKNITEHTKAIIPVHIQGFPCNMDAVMEIAKKHNLYVVEDACQADGGSFKGQRLATFGDAGAFSFNYYKIVSAGEGGAMLTNNKDLFERALIYHDSSAISFFGDQMKDFKAESFCGVEYRANEISAAIMNVQLDRLDSILADLRKNKKYMMDQLKDVCKFIVSNDIEGDCGTTVAVLCDTEEEAIKLAEGAKGTRPIDTDKHVYKNWAPILEKRGAFNPLMDPFKMEANKDIIPNYSKDMCPYTLDVLSRVVYFMVNPDATPEKMDVKINQIKAVLA